jgi:hypothetical protein
MEYLDTLAAKIWMGLFMDCARVRWSLKAFKVTRAWRNGLVLSLDRGQDSDMTFTLLKSVANRAKRFKSGNLLKEQINVPMKVWHCPLLVAYQLSKSGLLSRATNLRRI